MASGIYIITSPSGRQYVGSAVNVAKRWNGHRADLKRGQHHSPALQRAWGKYGEEAMSFRVLLICRREDLIFYEQRAIDALRPAYNVQPVAGSQLGLKHSEAARAKMSAAKKGRVPPYNTQPVSLEARAKMSAAKKGKPSLRRGAKQGPPWNKGQPSGRAPANAFTAGHRPWNKGIKSAARARVAQVGV